MKAIVGYKTQLNVNNRQASQISMFCGGARFAWNWALAKRIELYEKDKKSTNAINQHKEMNLLKKTDFPWAYDYSKCVFQESLRDLDKAFANFFRGINKGQKVGYPRFKSKKNEKHSFRLTGAVHVGDSFVQLPRLGKIKLYEDNYIPLDGKILSATVSKRAGRYFVSVQMEVELPEINPNIDNKVVGIDLGIKSLASCSNGMVFKNPKAYKKYLRKLKRLQRSHSRKQKDSHNKERSKQALANLHYKISNIRKDSIHKMTTTLTKDKSIAVLVLEDLSSKNMMKNHCLAQSIADSSFGEIKRQFIYKCKKENKQLVFVDRFYPSSKTCSGCGHVKDKLGLEVRTYVCEKCGLVLDRDYNASLNIAKQGTVSLTGTATVKGSYASGESKLQAKASGSRKTRKSKKEEHNIESTMLLAG